MSSVTEATGSFPVCEINLTRVAIRRKVSAWHRASWTDIALTVGLGKLLRDEGIFIT